MIGGQTFVENVLDSDRILCFAKRMWLDSREERCFLSEVEL